MIRLLVALYITAVSVIFASAQASIEPSGQPSTSSSTASPTRSPVAPATDSPVVTTFQPTAPALAPSSAAPSPTTISMFPTVAPVPPTPSKNDSCINAVCQVGTDDCSCLPGLRCRQRSDGQGNLIFLCSAVSKVTRNRISDGAGIGGAAGRIRNRERLSDIP